MDKNFPGKLKKLREARGLTQAQLGKMIGGDQTEVSRYERGARLPSTDKLLGLAKGLDVSVGLLTGEEDEKVGPPAAVIYASKSIPARRKFPERRSDAVAVPLVDEVVAARPDKRIRDREVRDWVWILRSQLGDCARHDLVCVCVKDNAMEPVLRSGAIACIDRNEKPTKHEPTRAGAIYALSMGGGKLLFRYVAVTDEALALISASLDKKQYPSLIVKRERELKDVIGRAVWIGHHLP